MTLKISVSQVAAKWYKDEFSIEGKEHIQFFARYGGIGGLVPGFSLGLQLNTPEDIYASTNVLDITFFVEQKDAWYFSGKHLKIQLNHTLNEPEFIYIDAD
ncbi:MAG TPA: hypothetical protein VK142_11395 [Bacillota bacterium]|nr:hypothetical protein [Bacillota bacterium]